MQLVVVNDFWKEVQDHGFLSRGTQVGQIYGNKTTSYVYDKDSIKKWKTLIWFRYTVWLVFSNNIARVLALHKSYWAAMNKIFIYARSYVNRMT
mgnify:CR=1 FL=1